MDAYESPDQVYHVILRNEGTSAIINPVATIVDTTSGTTLETSWIHTEPRTVQPAELARLYFHLPQPAKVEHSLTATIVTQNSSEQITFDAPPSKVDITYAVRDETDGKIFIYVRNNMPTTSFSVHEIRIDGQPLDVEGPKDWMRLDPAEKKLVFGDNARLEFASGKSIPVFAEIDCGTQTFIRHLHVFSSEHATMGWAENDFIIECPSHSHGTPEEAAGLLFARAADDRHYPRYVHICRANSSMGLPLFSQCLEKITFNPQASSPKLGTADWSCGILETSENAKRLVEPGIFFGLVKNDTSIPNSGTNKKSSFSELFATACAELAGGAKGFEFSVPGFAGNEKRKAEAVIEALQPIVPLVGISEPMPFVAPQLPGGVSARTLLCGNRAILLFVFLHRNNLEETHNEISLRLRLPSGVNIGGVIPIAPSSDLPPRAAYLQDQEWKIDRLQGFEAAVYVLPIEPR